MIPQMQLAIIGSGPAGLAAAIQAGRDGLRTICIGDEAAGGLVRAANRLDNLPGFPDGIGGKELTERLIRHAQRFGIEPQRGLVNRVRPFAGHFRLDVAWTDANPGCVDAEAVIVATGTLANPYVWEIPEHLSPRLHRDARSLPDDLSGRHVAVIGGGEASLDAALVAARRGADVRLFGRNRNFRAPGRLIAEARSAGVTLEPESSVTIGKQDSDAIRLSVGRRQTLLSFTVDHLIVSIGRQPNGQLLESFPEALDGPDDMITKIPGLFLAGDLIHGMDRFAAIALGDGVAAARLALNWLRGKRSDPDTPNNEE